jgi:hypothetical protein
MPGTPCPYFTDAEYSKLRETAKRLVSENVNVRGVPLTELAKKSLMITDPFAGCA